MVASLSNYKASASAYRATASSMSSPARYQYAEYERPLVGSLLQRQGLGGEYCTGPAAAAAISSRVRVVMPYLVGWAIGRTSRAPYWTWKMRGHRRLLVEKEPRASFLLLYTVWRANLTRLPIRRSSLFKSHLIYRTPASSSDSSSWSLPKSRLLKQ